MLTLTDETRLAFTQRMGDLTAPVRSAFIETVDQTSQSDYRPIAIGSRSIGEP